MRNTLIINVFGTSHVKKSTICAYIFALLKMQGIETELCTEFGDEEYNQFYLAGRRSLKISNLYGKTDVIVNEYPVLCGCFDIDNKYLKSVIVNDFMYYANSNINILLRDAHVNNDYSEDEQKIINVLHLKDIESDYEEIPYFEIESTQDGANKVVELILKILNNLKNNEEQC